MTYILITNDDGVNAPGILALAQAMRGVADKVQVIAPSVNQSMSGHKISLFQDIRVEESLHIDGDIPAVAVHGSPADCIGMAAHGLVDWPPDVVVSGINRGANMGQDVVYSGTVSAAMEATIQGIPALAVSLNSQQANTVEAYAVAARMAARVVTRMLAHTLPRYTMLNLNVPHAVDVRGLRLTRMGVRIYHNMLERAGEGIVRVVGDEPTGEVDMLGTDMWAVHNGYASLTPLHLDMTAHDTMADLAAWDVTD